MPLLPPSGRGRFAVRLSRALVALLLLTAGSPLAAQKKRDQPTQGPRPPRLENGADPKDWRSYFTCGVDADDPARETACFEWASRLDPARPEPFYARWLFHQNDRGTDSLRREALMRDPFIYHARVMKVDEPRYGVFSKPSARAWGALGAGDYFNAARYFTRMVADTPDDLDTRWGLAIAQYYRRNFDSAAVQVRALEAILRRRQERDLLVYHSLDFVAYMEAYAWLSGRQVDSARVALERALTESIALYRAHALLGDIAFARGDSAAADEHWSMVVQLRPDDPLVHREYGGYLSRRGRLADAERELRAALAGAPDWIDAHLALARALDAQGPTRAAEAATAYRNYLERAPVADSVNKTVAAKRATALGAP